MLCEDLKGCKAFSLVCGESTDVQDKPQLALFACLSKEITREELVNTIFLKETTCTVDIKIALLEEFDDPLWKLATNSTDDDNALSTVGKTTKLSGTSDK